MNATATPLTNAKGRTLIEEAVVLNVLEGTCGVIAIGEGFDGIVAQDGADRSIEATLIEGGFNRSGNMLGL